MSCFSQLPCILDRLEAEKMVPYLWTPRSSFGHMWGHAWSMNIVHERRTIIMGMETTMWRWTTHAIKTVKCMEWRREFPSSHVWRKWRLIQKGRIRGMIYRRIYITKEMIAQPGGYLQKCFLNYFIFSIYLCHISGEKRINDSK